MSENTRLHIDGFDLVFLPELERLARMAATLTAASIDHRSLIYCGIDGSGLQRKKTTDGLGVRQRTWGITYASHLAEAEEHQRFGSGSDQLPLDYATDISPEAPAIITYDAEKLAEAPDDRNIWVAADGTDNVNQFAKAILFID